MLTVITAFAPHKRGGGRLIGSHVKMIQLRLIGSIWLFALWANYAD